MIHLPRNVPIISGHFSYLVMVKLWRKSYTQCKLEINSLYIEYHFGFELYLPCSGLQYQDRILVYLMVVRQKGIGSFEEITTEWYHIASSDIKYETGNPSLFLKKEIVTAYRNLIRIRTVGYTEKY